MWDASVWGTAAAWWSALGTTGGVGAAAFYYIRDARRSANAQAKHIRVVMTGDAPVDSLSLTVFNDSDRAISRIAVLQELRTLEELIANEEVLVTGEDTILGFPRAEDIPRLRELMAQYPKGRSHYLSEDQFVKPYFSLKIDDHAAIETAFAYFLVFTDAAGERWKLRFDPFQLPEDPTFEAVRFPAKLRRKQMTWWDQVRHPKATRGYRAQQRELRRALKRTRATVT